MEDVKATFSASKEWVKRIGEDPNRVFVGGISAGGNLASLVQKKGPAGHLLISAPTDLTVQLPGSLDSSVATFLVDRRENGPAASAAHQVKGDTPRTAIIHGIDDDKVPHDQAVRYASRLQRALVPHVLLSIPGMGHGLDLADSRVRRAVDRATDWLLATTPTSG